MRDERTNIWIHAVQTRLTFRLGVYWLLAQVCVWNVVFIWRVLQEAPGNPVEQYGRFLADYTPALVGTLLLLPVLAWDALRFAHRVFGPVYRVRRTLQALAAGEPVRPVRLREDDFLGEVRDDVNHMLEALQRRGLPVLQPTGPDEAAGRQPA
jgi:hypothetical protein